MTAQLHITFAAEGIVYDADVEVTAVRDGRAWDFQKFEFADIASTDELCQTDLLDYMPEEVIDQAETEAENAFIAEYNHIA